MSDSMTAWALRNRGFRLLLPPRSDRPVPGLAALAAGRGIGWHQVGVYAVADVMDDRGWHLNRDTKPRDLHFMLSPIRGEIIGQFLEDLADAVARHGPSKGKEAEHS